ncbi:unnamed protein product [Rhizophagus irregularis]|nr:unnamed protein product [Rhizophagus irregularis]
MFNLAKCYHGGNGTENNFEEAFYWYQKSAENGYTYAMFNLAYSYSNGEGAEKNLEKAIKKQQKPYVIHVKVQDVFSVFVSKQLHV